MWVLIKLSCLVIVTVLLFGCNYHLFNIGNHDPTAIRFIVLNSYSPYNLLTRALRNELHTNNMILVNNINTTNELIPQIIITGSSEDKVIVSEFLDKEIIEYKIILKVKAQILTSEKSLYPADVEIYRLFFNHSLSSLASESEESIIRQEMRQQAARMIVNKLIKLQSSRVMVNRLNKN